MTGWRDQATVPLVTGQADQLFVVVDRFGRDRQICGAGQHEFTALRRIALVKFYLYPG